MTIKTKTKAIGLLSALVAAVLLVQPTTLAFWRAETPLLNAAVTSGNMTAQLTALPMSDQSPAEVSSISPPTFHPLYPAQERKLWVALNVKGAGDTLRWRYKVTVDLPAAVTAIDPTYSHIELFAVRPDCAVPATPVTVIVTPNSATGSGWIDCRYATNTGVGSTAQIALGLRLKSTAPVGYQGINLTPSFTVTVAQSVAP